MRFSDQWLRECVATRLTPAEVGARLTGVGMPLDSMEPFGEDTVYHFDITTNRPDCMNHLGLARELSVADGGVLQEPGAALPDSAGAGAAAGATLRVEAPDLCARYTALVVAGVRVGPSPAWLARRLEAIGLRPINCVVDATNYVLWELGHPLHAFDLDRLSGRAIRVRRAKPGERITTLDGVDRALTPEMLLIADDRCPVAIAGVMGGRDSEISARTQNVLLESAHFQAASVRRTSRALGLHTDASHRFERGADPEITLKAASRCAALIADLAGGRLAPGVLEARVAPAAARRISLRPRRVAQLLGLSIPEKVMGGILERLGCAVERSDASRWSVTPPTFRGDLALEEDLIEEVARHHGYDKIPVTLPRIFLFPEGRTEADRRLERVRVAVRHCGFSEALNLSLVSQAENRIFGDAEEGMRVLNPLAEGQDHLRASLIPGLVRNLAHNLSHQLPEGRLFETGRIFRPSPEGGLPVEEERLGLVLGGKSAARHWSAPERPPDFFDLKGAVDLSLRMLGCPSAEWRPTARPFLSSDGAAEILLSGRTLGWAGALAPMPELWPFDETAYAGEISLAGVWELLGGKAVFRHSALARTPAASRDLALIVDPSHAYSEIEAAIVSLADVPVAAVHLFDRYEGPPVPPGKVSLAIRVVFRSPERTLVSEEISQFLDRIIHRLRDRLGAELRGK